MALITKTLRPTGGNYSTPQAWEAAELDGVDMTAGSDKLRLLADTTWVSAIGSALLIDNTITDEDHYWILECEGDAKAKLDGWDSNAFRFEVSATYGIYVTSGHGQIIGVQLQNLGSGCYGIYFSSTVSGNSELVVDSCRIQSNQTYGRYGARQYNPNATSGYWRIINSIFTGWGYSSGRGIMGGQLDTFFFNNAVYDCDYGISCEYTQIGTTGRIDNNAVEACDGQCFLNAWRAYQSCNNNTSSDATSDDKNFSTGNQINVTPAWEDAANGDFRLQSGDTICIGNGLNIDSIFDWDMDGNTRPASPTAWDIGPHHYTVGITYFDGSSEVISGSITSPQGSLYEQGKSGAVSRTSSEPQGQVIFQGKVDLQSRTVVGPRGQELVSGKGDVRGRTISRAVGEVFQPTMTFVDGACEVVGRSSVHVSLSVLVNGQSESVGHSFAECRPRVWPMYLNRIVWPYAVNWKSQPIQAFEYNLRQQALGFVSPKYERFEQHAAAAWEWEVLLENEGAIDDFQAFTKELGGRLNGFWCPEPANAFEIVGGNSATQFYIRDIDLRSSWDTEASHYLLFRKAGQESRRAKILSMTEASGGRELVTVDASVSVDETWEAHNLIYCRLAEDDEDYDAMADNVMTRSVRIIELPREYAEIETGQKPVYLYAFWIRVPGGEHSWYATSLSKPVSSSGATYPSRAIEHGEWKDSIEGASESFEILSFYEDWNPLALFFPMKMPLPLWVRVFETTYAAPNTKTTLFTGRVNDVTIDGRLIRAKCASIVDILGRKFPRMMIIPRCNYTLYSGPCGIDRNQWRVVATISAIDGNIITVAGGVPESPDRFTSSPINRFARGYLVTGSGSGYEVRSIQKNGSEQGGTMVLQLNYALSNAQVGQEVTFYAGCDGSVETCRDQFNNFLNWGGHVIAPKNPVVKAIPIETSSGNKK